MTSVSHSAEQYEQKHSDTLTS